MANQSTVLFQSLTTSSTDVNGHLLVYPLISDVVKGAGFYGQTDAQHSVQYSTTGNFVGMVKMQGTLVQTPTDTDWYDIQNTTLGNGITPAFNQIVIINFAGNHVWLRGVVVSFTSGYLNNVLLNHN